jgi:hypothetical protein
MTDDDTEWYIMIDRWLEIHIAAWHMQAHHKYVHTHIYMYIIILHIYIYIYIWSTY